MPETTQGKSGNHKARAKKNARKRRRAEAKEEADGLDYKVPRLGAKKHTRPAVAITTTLDTESLPVASTGFVGKAEADWEEQLDPVAAEDLFPPNEPSEFHLVKYEPRLVC